MIKENKKEDLLLEKKSLLIVVEADPEKSPRFAEALRVAAGLSMHPRLSVNLVLKADILNDLNEGRSALWVDSDIIESSWMDLKENGCRIFSASPQDERFDCLIQFDC
ncbi:hypothetical protein IT6_08005 [Methylacidiphilum caldifontis]|uniref:hypothetical protein n=1 Tax=Methylacidiphilum caldifontis TaxID=2795386 RepID=UPI001A8C9685|nr:hypothetical protein [Methylacidiphilum caldifontis]QSR88315.1 hypothetical protein IT6_08005 [Methylacidiphilum caldifontis]